MQKYIFERLISSALFGYNLAIQFLSANFRPDIDLYEKYATISTSESKNIPEIIINSRMQGCKDATMQKNS